MLGTMAIGKGNPVYVNEYLRHWIKTEWLSKGRTGKELADRCGVDKATISDFKNGKRGAGYDLAAGIAAVQGRPGTRWSATPRSGGARTERGP